jgi:ADP-ribose pyrophosphatase YjhB (NUDIX family)
MLMCRRAQEPAQGKWTLPTGFLECGETLEAAAARETLEETGIRVEREELELFGIINMPAFEQVAIGFRTELFAEPRLRPNHECLDLALIPLDELPSIELAWTESMDRAIPLLIDEFRRREFNIHLSTLRSPDGATEFHSRRYKIASITTDHPGDVRVL